MENEWQDILTNLDTASLQKMRELSVQELKHLESMLYHWQQMALREISKRKDSNTDSGTGTNDAAATKAGRT